MREKSGWTAVGLVYFYSILCSASIGKVIPIQLDIQRGLGATPAAAAFAISSLFVVSCLFSTLGGALIERIGARRAIIGTSALMVLVDIVSFFAPGIVTLDGARVVEGIEYIGVLTAAPAVLMASTTGTQRIQAMTIWSTYIPAGFALGLFMAVPFAGTPNWRWTFAVHGLLYLVALCLGPLLPADRRVETQPIPGERGGMFAVLKDAGALRLALCVGLLSVMGMGTSTIAPIYLSTSRGLSLAAASSIVAVSNAATMLGGLLAGWALGRVSFSTAFALVAAIGAFAGALLYAPWVPVAATVAMLAFLFGTIGGGMAVSMAVLPGVAGTPARAAAVSGLLSQAGALVGFLIPPVYISVLGRNEWYDFAIVTAAAWLFAALVLPAHPHRAAGRLAAVEG